MQTKRMLIAAFAAMLAAPGLLFAQTDQPSGPVQNSSNSRNQDGSLQDSAGAGMTPRQMKDKMFLRKAAEGGMAEVELGKLAAAKASAEDVKAFGQKMVDDHTSLNQDMKPFVDSMGVIVPRHLSKKDKLEYEKLSGLSGAEFDNEYLVYMVKDHHEDLHEFRMEAATAVDPALRDAVKSAEKVIREHTMMVTKLAKAKGIALPARPPKPTS